MASKSKGGRKTTSLAAHGVTKERKSARFREPKTKVAAITEADKISSNLVNKEPDDEKESLAFKVLSTTQTKELSELETVEQVQDKMSEVMKLSQYSVDLKEAAMLDYYTAGFWWSKEQNYSQDQMSAFFTVMHTLLENVKERHLGVVDNLKEYKKMLVGVGIEHCDTSGGLDCFDVNQCKVITDYLYISLFQHYKLYELMFTQTQAEEIIGTDLAVEVAPAFDIPWPSPLEEGVAVDIHKGYIAPVTTTPDNQLEKDEPADQVTSETEVLQNGAAVTGAPTGDTLSIFGKLSPDEIKAIMKSVMDEMVAGLQNEVAQKLREKENAIIQRINKIHRVAEK